MIDAIVAKLADYAVCSGLVEERDRTWAVNNILEALKLDSYAPPQKSMLAMLEGRKGINAHQ